MSDTQPIGADDLALHRRDARSEVKLDTRPFQELSLLQAVVFGEQALELGRKRRVTCGDLRKPAGAAFASHRERLVQVRTEDSPTIRSEW